MLRYNEFGGAVIRQSDLSSWSRCNLQKKYGDEAKADPSAPQPEALSATVYGSVMHYAMMIMEQLWHERRHDALEVATATFEHYWHPSNIENVAERVTVWLPKQTWGGMLERGRRTLKDYFAILQKDTGKLLALEYQFSVPLVDLQGRQHTLTGTVDRLALRLHYRKPYLSVEDFKTGKQPSFLRWNMQGTAYAYASTRPEFWTPDDSLGEHSGGFDAETLDALERAFAIKRYSLYEGSGYEFPLASRRFRWLNLQEMSAGDGGWRSPRDYVRLRMAAKAYVDAVEAGIYMPSLTGEVCTYCPYQRFCGGTGIAPENEGAPA